MANQQSKLGLGTPWIIPYGITVGAVTETFVWIVVLLSFQRRLYPGVVILKAFILFVLYLTGMIGTASQLFGPIIKQCQGDNSSGLSVDSLLWLLQRSTCEDWYVVFGFFVVGMLFEVWILIVARQVLARST
ncbi:hypothetical protein MBLNU13_g00907t1 [Cladosporium sp. NU13]